MDELDRALEETASWDTAVAGPALARGGVLQEAARPMDDLDRILEETADIELPDGSGDRLVDGRLVRAKSVLGGIRELGAGAAQGTLGMAVDIGLGIPVLGAKHVASELDRNAALQLEERDPESPVIRLREEADADQRAAFNASKRGPGLSDLISGDPPAPRNLWVREGIRGVLGSFAGARSEADAAVMEPIEAKRAEADRLLRERRPFSLSGVADRGVKLYQGAKGATEDAFPLSADVQGNVVDNPELLGDFRWWMGNIGRFAPTQLASLIPALAGARAGAKVMAGARGTAALQGEAQAAQTLAQGARMAGHLRRLGIGAGAAAGAHLEAVNVYDELLRSGKGDQEALAGYWEAAVGSAAFNAVGLDAIVRGLPRRVKGEFLRNAGKTASVLLGRAGTEGLMEGGEEVQQARIQGQSWEEGLKAGATVFPAAFVLGILGGGVSGVGLEWKLPRDGERVVRETAARRLAELEGLETRSAEEEAELGILQRETDATALLRWYGGREKGRVQGSGFGVQGEEGRAIGALVPASPAEQAVMEGMPKAEGREPIRPLAPGVRVDLMTGEREQGEGGVQGSGFGVQEEEGTGERVQGSGFGVQGEEGTGEREQGTGNGEQGVREEEWAAIQQELDAQGAMKSMEEGAGVRDAVVGAPGSVVEGQVVEGAPSEAQKEAGNYKKAHVVIGGIGTVTIENPVGSVRRGTDKSGREWEQEMVADYGYLRGVKGADKDQLDVFVRPKPDWRGNVYVVEQVDPETGSFDEHKVMVGYSSREEAEAGYLGNYEEGWQGLGAMREMSPVEFKEWVKGGMERVQGQEGTGQGGELTAEGEEGGKGSGFRVQGIGGEEEKLAAEGAKNVAGAEGGKAGGAWEKETGGPAVETGEEGTAARLLRVFPGAQVEVRDAGDARVTLPNGVRFVYRQVASIEPGARGRARLEELYGEEFASRPDVAELIRGAWFTADGEGNAGEEVVDGAGLLLLASRAGEDTLRHERVHVARRLGLFSAEEWAALVDRYAAGETDVVRQEERVARALGEDKRGEAKTVLEQIRAFVRKLVSVMAGDRASDVERLMESSEFWGRNGEQKAAAGQALESLSWEGLKARAKAVGVKSKGTKASLIAAVREAERQTTMKSMEGRVHEATETISGRMTLDEFEEKGYRPNEVTRAEWVALQQANRRYLGQPEGPVYEFEDYHRGDVERALQAGEDVDERVLADYPELVKKGKTSDVSEEELTAGGAVVGAGDMAGMSDEAFEAVLDEVLGKEDEVRVQGSGFRVQEEEEGRGKREEETGKGEQAAAQAAALKKPKRVRKAGEKKGAEWKRKKAPSERSAADIAASAASHGVKGAGEALAGLHALFGGKKVGIVAKGPFDEETWRQAKPHFEAAYREFVAAGRSVKEFVEFLAENFGSGIRPYLRRYREELKKDPASSGADSAVASPGKGKEETFEEFKKKYLELWRLSNKYTPDQVGSGHYLEQMAAMSDAHPDWVETIENEEGTGDGGQGTERAKKNEQTLHAAVEKIAQSGESGVEKGRQLRALAKEYGEPVKRIQELYESALVWDATDIAEEGRENPRGVFDALVKLYEGQAVLGTRTSTSVQNQAYSTPLPLAWAVQYLIDARGGRQVYEPTAGNGALVFTVSPGRVHVNELDGVRLENLRGHGYGKVTSYDASSRNESGKPDRIVMNPPFGSVKTQWVDGFKVSALDHLIAMTALGSLAPDGRAVLILGAQRDEGAISRKDEIFLNWLYGRFEVSAHFEVSGDLYARQGASWPVRVIAIRGRKAEVVTGKLAPERVERLKTWSEVYTKVEESRNEIESRRAGLESDGDRTGADRPASWQESPTGVGAVLGGSEGVIPAVVAGGERAGTDGGGEPSGDGGELGSGLGGTGKPGGRGGQEGGRGAGARPAGGNVQSGVESESDVSGVVRGDRGSAEEAGAGERGGVASGARGDVVGRSDHGAADSGLTAEASAYQTQYSPVSGGTGLATLTPKYMAEETRAFLEGIDKSAPGGLDEWVRGQLGYDTLDAMYEALSAEQIDAAAGAIWHVLRGRGAIIGDQTGVGKGRVALGMARWAVENGHVPVFITKDAKLFTDAWRDALDTGTAGMLRPLLMGDQDQATIVDPDDQVLNRAKPVSVQKAEMAAWRAGGGESPNGYNAVFLTYSQLQNMAGSAGSRVVSEQQRFLEWLFKNRTVVPILDEAHEAAGEKSMRNVFMIGGIYETGKGNTHEEHEFEGILNMRGAQGVVYLSATFAKRPESMPLYNRTDMFLAVQRPSELARIFKKGKLGLQRLVSKGLAHVGQMFRRELNFGEITLDTVIHGADDPAEQARLVRQVDGITEVMRAIKSYSELVVDAISDLGETGTTNTSAGLGVTEFANILHNQISQMLLAAKADATVERALAAFKRGEKPVITLQYTMEGYLGGFAADAGIGPGDEFDGTFKNVLQVALDRTMRAKEKTATGDVAEIHQFRPEDLGLEREYRRIVEMIGRLAVDLPASPIDYIRMRLQAAGVRVDELTGRQLTVEYGAEGKRGVLRARKVPRKSGVVNRFNRGETDALILNASGSTGLSLHASLKVEDQRTRHMIVVQPNPDINAFVQTLGRIFRSGMIAGRAKYTLLSLPLEAERRAAVFLATKMKSLNANTTANSDAAMKVEAADLFNKYGDRAVAELMTEDGSLISLTGIHVDFNETTGTVKPMEDLARKFTGRIAILPNRVQADLYDRLHRAFADIVEQAKARNEYDLDIEEHEDWDGIEVERAQLLPDRNPDSVFESGVQMVKYAIRDTRPTPTAADALELQALHMGDDPVAHLRAMAKNVRDQVDAYVANQDKEHLANDARSRWAGTQEMLTQVLRALRGPVRVFVGDEVYAGLITNVTYAAPKGEGSPAAGSRWKVTFTVNAPFRTVHASGAEIMQPSRDGESFGGMEVMGGTVESAFEREADAENRIERYFLMGNPIAAMEIADRGTYQTFTTDTGEKVTGLMMPRSWRPEQMANDPRNELRSGAAVMRYLSLRVGAMGYKDRAEVSTLDGVLVISRGRWETRFKVQAPKSRKTGGRYYLNSEIVGITGDFSSSGNRMEVSVDTETAERLAEYITKQLKTNFVPRGRMDIERVAQANAGWEEGTGNREVEYSKGGRGKGMTRAAVEAALTGLRRRWVNGPKNFEVVGDPSELPRGVQRSDARGAFDPKTDRVWVVASNVGSVEEAVFVAVHEVIGHRGIEAVLESRVQGSGFRVQEEQGGTTPRQGGAGVVNRFYDGLAAARVSAVRGYARAHGMGFGTKVEKRTAAREWLADRVAAGELDGPAKVWWQRLAEMLRDALRRLTGRGDWTESALRKLVRDAGKWTEGKGFRVQGSGFREEGKLTAENAKNAEEEGEVRYSVAGPGGSPVSGEDDAFVDAWEAGAALVRRLTGFSKRVWDARRREDVNARPELAWWNQVFQTIHWYKEKVPQLKKLYESGLRLLDRKFGFEEEIFGTGAGEAGSELGLVRKFAKTAKAEWARLEGYLWQRDMDRIGYRVQGSGFRKGKKGAQKSEWVVVDPEGKERGRYGSENEAWSAAYLMEGLDLVKAGLSKEAAQTLVAIRRMTHRMHARLLREAWEVKSKLEALGLDVPKVQLVDEGETIEVDLFEALREMGDLRGSYMPRMRKGGRYQLIARKDGVNPILETFDSKGLRAARAAALEGQGYRTTLRLSERPSEEAFLEANIVALNDLVNNALERVTVAQKGVSLAEFNIRSEWQTTKDGKREFVVKAPDRKPINEIMLAFMGQRYDAKKGDGWGVAWHFVEPVNENLEKDIAASLARKIYGEEAVEQAFAEAFVGQMAALIHSRGSRARKIGRGDVVGEEVFVGYERNALKALVLAGKGIAGGSAKRLMAREMMKVVTGTEQSWQEYVEEVTEGAGEELSPLERNEHWRAYERLVQERRLDSATQPRAYKDGLAYMREMLRNETQAERVVGAVRGVAALKYLSGLGSALVNVTALATTVPAALHAYGDIGFDQTVKNLAKAMPLYVRHFAYWKWGKGEALTGDNRWLFDEISRRGWDTAQYNVEAMRAIEGKISGPARVGADVVMAAFNMTERLNRASTIAAAYWGLKAQTKGEWVAEVREEALAKAKEISDNAHAVYGKGNLPSWARGEDYSRQMARSWYMFKTFTHNMLQLTVDIGVNQRDYRALAWALVSPAVLAGPGALIGKELVAGLIKIVFKVLGQTPPDDPEEGLADWAEEMFGWVGRRLMRSGLLGFTGVNVGGSLEVRLPSSAEDVVGMTLWDVLGAPGSVFLDVKDAALSLAEGDLLRAAEKLSPRFAAGTFRGIREYTEGLRSERGEPKWYGKEKVYASGLEAVVRALGFNPARLAEISGEKFKESKIMGRYAEERAGLYERAREYWQQETANRDPDEWLNIKADVIDYNARAERLKPYGVKITTDGLRAAIRGTKRPPKEERMRSRQQAEREEE